MPKILLITASGTAQRRLLATAIKRLESEGYGEMTRQEGGDWSSLLTENMSAGLFADRRAVLIEEAEKLGSFPESCLPLLHPEAPVVILLVYSVDPAKWLSKEALARCEILKSKEEAPKPWERARWVQKKAREMGLELKNDAAELLAERVENPEEIEMELLKFVPIATGGNVSVEQIETLSAADGNSHLLRFLDSLCAGDFAVCAPEMVLLGKEKAELFPFLAAVQNRMRLAWYAACFPGHLSAIARSLGARDYAWKLAQKAASVYGKDALGRFIARSITIHLNEKVGAGAGWVDLQIAILELLGAGKK